MSPEKATVIFTITIVTDLSDWSTEQIEAFQKLSQELLEVFAHSKVTTTLETQTEPMQ